MSDIVMAGGVQFNFVEEKLADEFLDQFSPFKTLYDVPYDEPFKATIFRYPLRTNEDSIESEPHPPYKKKKRFRNRTRLQKERIGTAPAYKRKNRNRTRPTKRKNTGHVGTTIKSALLFTLSQFIPS
jgi:hypothetical protein